MPKDEQAAEGLAIEGSVRPMIQKSASRKIDKSRNIKEFHLSFRKNGP